MFPTHPPGPSLHILISSSLAGGQTGLLAALQSSLHLKQLMKCDGKRCWCCTRCSPSLLNCNLGDTTSCIFIALSSCICVTLFLTFSCSHVPLVFFCLFHFTFLFNSISCLLSSCFYPQWSIGGVL